MANDRADRANSFGKPSFSGKNMKHLLFAAGVLLASIQLAQACPVAGVGALQLSYDAVQMDMEYSVDVVAGGDVDLSDCGYVSGWVITEPDVSFTLSGINGPLQVSIDSPGCDTVLLINAPDGSWHYDDDSWGELMPTLQAFMDDGRLDVWVGTYDGSVCDAQIVLN